MHNSRCMRQMAMKFRTWGGARKGAGRPQATRVVPRVRREALAARFPVLVTWRMRPGVWNLRSRRGLKALVPAMWAGGKRDGFRLIHAAIMGNHIHMIVEASDRMRLARGMQGLGVRIAKRLNRMMGAHGRVLNDRYHAEILRTPTQTLNAYRYLQKNDIKHYGRHDPRFVTHKPLVTPQTWLMRQIC